MQIRENFSLKPYNTFGINATAAYFTSMTTVSELEALLSFTNQQKIEPPLVIGGGSNILLTHDYKGLVIINQLLGIEVVSQDLENVFVKAGAGVNWHELVVYCIKNNYAGLENLSLIPGSVGASPIQNIGAYGVEIKDVFYELEAFNINERRLQTFSAKECEFGYRESIFKKKLKGKYIITSVIYKLNKTPSFNTEYGAIQQELEKMNIKDLSIAAISQAVINIRQSKLPDPKVIGNAGSFFKNPTIGVGQFVSLQKVFPGIVGFPAKGQEIKVAAGWLIEQCGWKGYRKGDAGCHANQALVLVNYGNANGIDIYNLSTEIMHSVEAKFGILLEREVNVV